MDSVAGAWAAIEGVEFCNVARTVAYLRGGYGPPKLTVNGECDCPEDQLRTLVGCDDAPYSTPADDGAPWYDAAIPESADFAGFYPTSFDGLDSTYTRDVVEIVSGGGGGVLGRLRAKPRAMVWRGFLFGRTCCSVAYGLRWLTSVLRQSRCGAECGGEKLDLLVCCPPPAAPVGGDNAIFLVTPSSTTYTGGTWTLSYGGHTTTPLAWNATSDDIVNALWALPSIGSGNAAVSWSGTGPPLGASGGFAVIFENDLGNQPITGLMADGSGLTGPSGPYIISSSLDTPGTSGTPTPTCASDCRSLSPPGLPADDDAFRTLYNVGLSDGPHVRSQRAAQGGCGCSTIMEVEFTLTAGNPHFYRSPVLLADGLTFETGLCPDWADINTPEGALACEVQAIETARCDVQSVPVATDPNCPTPILPPVFGVDESCFFDPFAPTVVCANVPASTWGADFQGAPVFSIYSGAAPLRSTSIRLIENPLGSDCDALSADPCNFCEFITIRYFPAFSTLTIDGVNRRVTITTPGGDVQSGEQFMVGNYTWPLLECVDYCVCATIDGFTAAADATFSLSIYPLEM